ncbi:MAG: carbohydrate kinase family protein [Oscillospiraceae bacterium]|jgi:sugar/nucleoside kinase (ribokinase family)
MGKAHDFSIIMCGQITMDDLVLMDEPVKRDNMGGDYIYGLSGAFMWGRDRIGSCVRVGNDFDTDLIRKATRDEVDLSGAVKVDMPGLRTFELFDRYGNRYFVRQKWAGDDTKLACDSISDYPEKYRGNTDSICIAPIPFPYSYNFIKQIPSGDAVLMVDPHFDSVYEKDRPKWEEIFPKIDIWAPSESELTDFFGIGRKEDIKDYIPYLRQVASMGVDTVVLKIGERGSMAYERDSGRTWHVPPCRSRGIVDVTGCGDTFCGGFISGYLRRRDVLEALMYGSVAASFCIEHYGSLDNFHVGKEEADKRFSEYSGDLDRSGCLVG